MQGFLVFINILSTKIDSQGTLRRKFALLETKMGCAARDGTDIRTRASQDSILLPL